MWFYASGGTASMSQIPNASPVTLDSLHLLIQKIDTEHGRKLDVLSAQDTEHGRKLDVLAAQINPLIDHVAALTEDSLRVKAADLFGKSFCRNFMALSIRDLVHLLTKAHYQMLMPNMEEHIAAANQIAEAVQAAVTPLGLKLLQYIGEFVPENSEARRLYSIAENSWIDKGDLRKALGILIQVSFELNRNQWIYVLRRLKKGFSGNVKDLLSCDGPGILLADLMVQAEIWRENSRYGGPDYVVKFLATVQDPFSAFSEEIEFDMRGTISLIPPHATISTGEIKSSKKKSSAAAQQLARRCRVLHWAVQTVFPGQFTTKTLVGRVFLQRRQGESAAGPPRMDEDVSIFVHRL